MVLVEREHQLSRLRAAVRGGVRWPRLQHRDRGPTRDRQDRSARGDPEVRRRVRGPRTLAATAAELESGLGFSRPGSVRASPVRSRPSRARLRPGGCGQARRGPLGLGGRVSRARRARRCHPRASLAVPRQPRRAQAVAARGRRPPPGRRPIVARPQLPHPARRPAPRSSPLDDETRRARASAAIPDCSGHRCLGEPASRRAQRCRCRQRGRACPRGETGSGIHGGLCPGHRGQPVPPRRSTRRPSPRECRPDAAGADRLDDLPNPKLSQGRSWPGRHASVAKRSAWRGRWRYLGTDAELRHVTELAHLDGQSVAAAIAGLRREGILTPRDGPLDFVHPLIRTAVYATVTEPELGLGHPDRGPDARLRRRPRSAGVPPAGGRAQRRPMGGRAAQGGGDSRPRRGRSGVCGHAARAGAGRGRPQRASVRSS